MLTLFIQIKVLDIIDIVLVAFLLYQLYHIIKGTVAINIFIGIFIFYMVWLLVKALNMQLLSIFMGQIIGVGVIALIIVFQQEIRRFLLLVGTRSAQNRIFPFEKMIFGRIGQVNRIDTTQLTDVCFDLASKKTGALIVIARKSGIELYARTGDILNADFSTVLIETIFHKKSPLHDGAVIIRESRIYAARCVLPVTDKTNLPSKYGLRHKAAIGMSENTDSIIVIISETSGKISVAKTGEIKTVISKKELLEYLNTEMTKQ